MSSLALPLHMQKGSHYFTCDVGEAAETQPGRSKDVSPTRIAFCAVRRLQSSVFKTKAGAQEQ